MSLLEYFLPSAKKNSAKQAKERLQIIVAHERSQRNSNPDYLPAMKKDIIEVIKRYVDIEYDMVQVNLDNTAEDISVLELNITLPDEK